MRARARRGAERDRDRGAGGGETQAVTSRWAGERPRAARTAPRSPSSATPGSDTRRRLAPSIHAPRARRRRCGRWRAWLAVLLGGDRRASDRAKAAEDDAFEAKLRDRIEARSRGHRARRAAHRARGAGAFLQGSRRAPRAGSRTPGEGCVRDALARDLLRALGESERHGLDPAAYHTARARPRARAPRNARSRSPREPRRAALGRVPAPGAPPRGGRGRPANRCTPASRARAMPRPTRCACSTRRSRRKRSPRRSRAARRATASTRRSWPSSRGCARRRRPATSRRGARLNPVRASLERWRWLPRELGRRHVRVNAASFGLEAFDGDEVKVAMRVVVGEKDWKTPLAHGVISHLELNPDWRIPRSIATREMLPEAQRDSRLLPREGDPGAARRGVFRDGGGDRSRRRSTGRTSIPRNSRTTCASRRARTIRSAGSSSSFENPVRRVPARHAERSRVHARRARRCRTAACGSRTRSRSRSSRSRPIPRGPRSACSRRCAAPRRHRLPLPEPLPVYLVYFTAFAKPDGKVSFSADAYGWDRELLAALDAQVPKTARAPRSSTGTITTGVPTALRAAMKSMSASARPMQPWVQSSKRESPRHFFPSPWMPRYPPSAVSAGGGSASPWAAAIRRSRPPTGGPRRARSRRPPSRGSRSGGSGGSGSAARRAADPVVALGRARVALAALVARGSRGRARPASRRRPRPRSARAAAARAWPPRSRRSDRSPARVPAPPAAAAGGAEAPGPARTRSRAAPRRRAAARPVWRSWLIERRISPTFSSAMRRIFALGSVIAIAATRSRAARAARAARGARPRGDARWSGRARRCSTSPISAGSATRRSNASIPASTPGFPPREPCCGCRRDNPAGCGRGGARREHPRDAPVRLHGAERPAGVRARDRRRGRPVAPRRVQGRSQARESGLDTSPRRSGPRSPSYPPWCPPGPDNPLGSRWLTIGRTSYGIHGTNVRWSIGREATHGCLRLYEDDIRRLFGRVREGTRLQIVYQTAKWGGDGKQIFLEVHPDLYGLRRDRLAALEVPRALGLLEHPRSRARPARARRGARSPGSGRNAARALLRHRFLNIASARSALCAAVCASAAAR